jgi:cytochrome c oxidase subunit II
MTAAALTIFQRLVPEAASTAASKMDHLFLFLTVVTVFFTVGIFGTIFLFSIKYRQRDDRIPPATGKWPEIEVIWILVPVVLCAIMFVWGAQVFFAESQPPQGAIEVFVIGKQWMWHLQHAEGQREINELHVPVNVPVKLTMTSQDVIHDFFVPAFREKKDVVPGRYTIEWFQATKTGRYHLFCAQYCGTMHASMIGWVYVMEPKDYAVWLQQNATEETTAQTGQKLFVRFQCASCHLPDRPGIGPSLREIFGTTAALQGGQKRLVDESFLRQKILDPRSLPIPGYPQVMPTFRGQLDEDQILQLINFIKSMD